MSFESIQHLVSVGGYWMVAAVVALESMGIPVPGETTLVAAAIYAGTTHQLKIGWVIAAAAAGAIVGDNIGYWIGRRFGYPLLLRYGRVFKIDSKRIELGHYLFERHGGKVVFFGRFVALLRTLAALLAGVNRMGWWRFLLFNALGGVTWATCFGLLAYSLGERVKQLHGPIAIATAAGALAAVVGSMWFVRRHERALYRQAQQVRSGAPHARPAGR